MVLRRQVLDERVDLGGDPENASSQMPTSGELVSRFESINGRSGQRYSLEHGIQGK
jgi:hypothetical protein